MFSYVHSRLAWVARHELWLFLLLAPVFVIPTRWTWLTLIPLALLWIARRCTWGYWTKRTPADLPIAVLVVCATVAFYPSVDWQASSAGWWRIIFGVAMYYALVNGLQSQHHIQQWSLLLVGGGLGLALITLLGARWDIVRLANWSLIYDHLPELLRDVEDGLGFHPRIMGMALATMVPIPLTLAFSRNQPLLRWLAIVAIPSMLGVIVLTQSIQGLFGVAVAVCVLFVWYSRWTLVLLPIGALLAFWFTRLPQFQTLTTAIFDPDHALGIAVLLRLDMWNQAWSMLHDLPYTGIGLNTFPAIQTHFYPGFLLGPEPHAHNVYLQVALDLGIFGLIAFLMLLVASALMIWQIQRYTQHQHRLLVAGLAASIVSFLASGGLDTFWTTKPAVLLWVILGTVGALYGQIDRPAQSRINHYPSLIGALLALISLIWLPNGTFNRNLARIPAQQALYTARQNESASGMAIAALVPTLQTALADDPTNPYLYSLLGSLAAWSGEYPMALDYFHQRMQIDLHDPLVRYVPPGSLRQRALTLSRKPADQLIYVYTQWMHRFPERAEAQVQVALVWQHAKADPAQAQQIINRALKQTAQPQAFVLFYKDRVGTQ